MLQASSPGRVERVLSHHAEYTRLPSPSVSEPAQAEAEEALPAALRKQNQDAAQQAHPLALGI